MKKYTGINFVAISTYSSISLIRWASLGFMIICLGGLTLAILINLAQLPLLYQTRAHHQKLIDRSRATVLSTQETDKQLGEKIKTLEKYTHEYDKPITIIKTLHSLAQKFSFEPRVMRFAKQSFEFSCACKTPSIAIDIVKELRGIPSIETAMLATIQKATANSAQYMMYECTIKGSCSP